MQNQQLHIVCLDNPFPPAYGGVIDIFYKVKALHELGCRIHLHCFVDHIPESSPELDAISEKVYFYKKNKSVLSFLSRHPFSVKSRYNAQLFNNMQKVNAPIIFESLKPTAVMRDLKPIEGLKILRMHNIEHDYFNGIAQSETNLIKKILYLFEASKFKKYESVISQFDHVLTLSLKETEYIKSKFGRAKYIPLFHGNDTAQMLSPFGNYAVYHGDLNISDNRKAVGFVIEIFKEIVDYPLVVAASDNHEFVRKRIDKASNITIVKPDNFKHLQNILADAHINILLSYQPAGTKLKLVNALHNSRHCLINENMVDDPEILKLCTLASGKEEFIKAVLRLRNVPYNDFERRSKVLATVFDDRKNAAMILETINKDLRDGTE